jgi:hypothetical protein
MRRFLKVGILGAGLVGSVVLSALVLPYLVSGAACTTIAPTVPVSTEVAYGIPGSTRHEADTYLTFPEWYIVYSAEEYAQFIAQHPPQQFPFLKPKTMSVWKPAYWGSIVRFIQREMAI